MATYWENSCSFGLRYVSWYKYLIVSLVFSHLGFWSGNLFLIAPFPDLCLLVPFCRCFMPSFKIIGLLVLKKNNFKGFSIYSHGGHFGQVTLTINTNFCSPSTKFGFDRPCGCREDV